MVNVMSYDPLSGLPIYYRELTELTTLDSSEVISSHDLNNIVLCLRIKSVKTLCYEGSALANFIYFILHRFEKLLLLTCH